LNDKTTLFVTRFGLSDRTAIGVQTRYLVDRFQNHLHLYWNEGLFDSNFPHSRRIEERFHSRLPFLKTENVVSRFFRKSGLSLWKGDMPSAALDKLLVELRSQLSSAYLAPIDGKDALRMKAIITTLQLPFVVHLWDFLDNGATHEETRWLIANANHVFCLNRSILRVVHNIQPNSSILTFTRQPAKITASLKSGDELVVAIMGDIGSYREGVRCLVRAIELLRRGGLNGRVLYIGRQKALRQFGFDGHKFVTSTGFLTSAEDRDRILSECSVGFMPGPAFAPEVDARSAYSIPSRVLDFMAVGLPFVGTVHPRSATFEFCRDLGIAGGLLPSLDSDSLAQTLLRFSKEREWSLQRQLNLAGFDTIVGAHGLAPLAAALKSEGCAPG
jgi:glycosyltransferase involved in cell wall biosynthesis